VPDDPRARALVLAHGWNAMAYQVLNPGFVHWFAAADDALVGYVRWGRTRVVGGAPICAAERVAAVVREFEDEAHACGERVTWFGAGERLERLYAGDDTHAFLPLGAQPWWDPRTWDEVVRRRKRLREQVARARAKGVTVTEWPAAQAHASPRLQAVLDAWLSTRGLPPLHFLVESNTLDRLADRRVVVATREATVVAFMVATPIPARRGWLIEQWPRRPDAPNGTIECLLDATMRALAATGAEQVTLGLAPLSTRAPQVPMPDGRVLPTWLRGALAWGRAHGRRFYDFEGLDAFKSKFAPAWWEPLFAIVDRPRVTPGALWAIAGAFGQRNPARLGAQALARAATEEWRRVRR
jgi:phosphatidylglycerol lysyltransferase